MIPSNKEANRGIMTDGKYCGECIHIVSTQLGSYCKETGKNLERQSIYSQDENDSNSLLRHCINKHETKKMCEIYETSVPQQGKTMAIK